MFTRFRLVLFCSLLEFVKMGRKSPSTIVLVLTINSFVQFYVIFKVGNGLFYISLFLKTLNFECTSCEIHPLDCVFT